MESIMSKKDFAKVSWKNLEAAFAGESMAYQKYMYFAKIARKNGDEVYAKLFEDTAAHETKHAEGLLRHLYPIKTMTTRDCLRIAMEGEEFEYTEMYPQYAKKAEEEKADPELVAEFRDGIQECKEHSEMFARNLEKAVAMFKGLANVEQEHHDNYRAAMEGAAGSNFKQSDQYLAKTKGD